MKIEARIENDPVLQELDRIALEQKETFSLRELLTLNISETPCLWVPFFRNIGVHALVGEPDSGKSLFAQHFAIAVANKDSTFLGYPLNVKHGRVIFVETEDDKAELARRVKRQCAGFNINESALDGLQFVTADITGSESKNFYSQLLDEMISLCPVDLIIVSSFGDMFLGNDANSNSQMRETVNGFVSLARKHNCLIILIHHINKANYGKTPTQSGVQGGSGFAQKVRCVMQLSVTGTNERSLSIVKGNHIPNDIKKDALVLKFLDTYLLFESSGMKMARSEVGGTGTNQNISVNWDLVFAGKETMKRGELVSRLFQLYEIGERVADTILKTQLKKVGHGVYGIP